MRGRLSAGVSTVLRPHVSRCCFSDSGGDEEGGVALPLSGRKAAALILADNKVRSSWLLSRYDSSLCPAIILKWYLEISFPVLL